METLYVNRKNGVRTNADSYNYGIALLKVVFSFEVILCHFWNNSTHADYNMMFIIFDELKQIAVPFFMAVSFYFFTLKLKNISDDEQKIFLKKRLINIFYTYVGWGVLYYIILQVWNILYKETFEHVSIYSLLWQLIGGSCLELCPQFWYISQLMILTMLTGLLSIVCKNSNSLFGIISICTIFAFFMQYSLYNVELFGMSRYEIKFSYGRMMEMIPYTWIGICIANNIETIKNSNIIVAIICGMTLVFVYKYNFFAQPPTFGYGGLLLFIKTVCVVILGIIIPLNKLHPLIKQLLKRVAALTYGIYCFHWLVGLFFSRNISAYYSHKFLFCICIWVSCIFLTYILTKQPVKFLKKLVIFV